MPFKSAKQRRYLEMIAHNPKRAKELGKSEKEIESIKGFNAEAEKMEQPKEEKVKPRFARIMGKIGKK